MGISGSGLVWGEVGAIFPGPRVTWHHAGVAKKFSDPNRCQTAWLARSPGDPLGAEGGTFLGLTGSVGTLAPLFLVQVSIGTMPVSQKIFQTPSGVKLLGWRQAQGTRGARTLALLGCRVP